MDLYYHGGGSPQEVLVKKVLSDTKIILHYLYPYQISLENEDFGDCYRYYIFNGGYFTPCFLKNVFYTKCLVQEIMTSEIFSMFFFSPTSEALKVDSHYGPFSLNGSW